MNDNAENYVAFGTPLEALDEDEMPRKKPLTLEDQIARDANGRRRFHGAFTGGFSAGFYNTVGSLEGWRPAEFKSSRSERSVSHIQNPHDFMDDEDTGEFGIAPNRLMAKEEFSDQKVNRKRPAPSFSDGPIPGLPVLQSFIQPTKDTMGVRLLKRMGWKPGQGIGPRVSAVERQEENRRTYGCEPPPGFGNSNDSDDDIDLGELTFAPRDIEPYLVDPKKDSFGLGYSGLDRRSVLGTVKKPSTSFKYSDKNRKLNIKGQAFGVGAFEEDDEDIYSREDMNEYDFALEDEKTKKTQLQITAKGCLDGFIQAKAKVIKKLYPLPVIPVGFRGRHRPRKSRFEPVEGSEPAVGVKAGLGRHDISAQERSAIINDEADVAVVPKASIPFVSVPEVEAEPVTQPIVERVVNRPTASLLTSGGFKPFLHNPDKQKRYEQFLSLTDKSKFSDLQPMSLSKWEKERERREFEQAALIYKPLAGVMEDRFTRAAQPDDMNNPLAVVEKVKHGDESKRNAAKLKLFGPLTREEIDWAPCSMLCKRFNVPEPGTSLKVVEPKKKTKYSIFDSLDALVKKEPLSPAPMRVPVPVVEERMEEIEDQTPGTSRMGEAVKSVEASNEPIFIDPATKVDLFKAIFLDSSDDENEPEQPVVFDEPVTNTERNLSPPRGIFANIDLEAISARKTVVAPTALPVVTKPVPEPIEIKTEDGTYGPRIPDQLDVAGFARGLSSSSSSENEWEEKSSRKVKKSKKHKKHKKKHKKKNKK